MPTGDAYSLRTPGPIPFGICIFSSNRNHTTYLWRLPIMTFTEIYLTDLERFQQNICNGCGMPTPDTWSRPFGTCICSTCRDQSFSELVVILPDYALRISLGTFSILLGSMPLISERISSISLLSIFFKKNSFSSILSHSFIFTHLFSSREECATDGSFLWTDTWSFHILSFMFDMGISSNIMKSPSPKCYKCLPNVNSSISSPKLPFPSKIT